MSRSDEQTIVLPKSPTIHKVAEFSQAIFNIPEASSLYIETPNDSFYTPSAALVISSCVRRLTKQRRHSCDIIFTNGDPHGYLAHIGFYQALNVDIGKMPGQAQGGMKYIPITEIDLAQFHFGADRQHVFDLIQEKANNLATLLIQKRGGKEFDQLSYCIREILRNVADHSSAMSLWLCGQYYPSQNAVEIAILDEGIGIRTSLSNNSSYKSISDSDALDLAIKAGVSGKTSPSDDEIREDPQGIWNQGYGLYVVSELCRRFGSFAILSGTAYLSIESRAWEPEGAEYTSEAKMKGTAIKIRIELSKIRDWRGFLTELNPEKKRGPSLH